MTVTTNAIKENTTTEINGKPINGLNPEAAAELLARATAAGVTLVVGVDGNTTPKVKALWNDVTGTLSKQSDQSMISVASDYTFTHTDGKQYTIPADTEVNPMFINADKSAVRCRVRAKGFAATVQYEIPMTALHIEGGSLPGAGKVNDELAQAAEKATKLVGLIPSFVTDKDGKIVKDATTKKAISIKTDDHTTAEWAAMFPDCTLGNIAAAIQAIHAFRVNREAQLAAAIEAGSEQAIVTALDEYKRAKSWEQDVYSTAKNCGIYS